MNCIVCQKKSYSDFCMAHKPRTAIKTNKALPRPKRHIKQQGARTLAYNTWRDEVARPYLIAEFGEVCSVSDCHQTEGLEIDHKLNRGSHPELKMVLSNLQLLCPYHHRQKTDHIKENQL